jgi:hypothetical protein
MDKIVLLASFIFRDRLDWFLNYLENKFNIPKKNVFIYEVEGDDKLMVTFKFKLNNQEKFNFKKILPNTKLIHKKGNAIYSINALNKLIEINHPENIGNINYKSVQIDWTEYQGKLLLIRHNELSIVSISRIL